MLIGCVSRKEHKVAARKAAPKQPARRIEQASVLVLKEKYGVRYIRIDNDADLFVAFRKVIRDRLEDGHWYQGEDAIAAENAANGPSDAAHLFCVERSGRDYEGFSIETLEFAG